jgi:hypothetical protein
VIVHLEQIQAVVRPRNSWEAIDLGFSMVRLWWQPLYKLWFFLVLPWAILVYLLFAWFKIETFWLATVIVWWLKPLFDRVVLYFLSYSLFGEHPNLLQTLQALPTLLFKSHLLLTLTLWRFDLARSFNLPVWQLEESSQKVATERIRQLQKKTRHTAVWLTITSLHFEAVVLYFSFFGLLYFMIPSHYDINWWLFLLEHHVWFEILAISFQLLALSIIEPLYVAAGFALYLNRRTHLEGWDIELTFRRLVKPSSNSH